MSLHTPTLWVAFACVLVLATVGSAAVGLRQNARRGSRWWVVANAGFAGALVLHAHSDVASLGATIAAVLALQWPIVTLAGIRRFYARGGTRISEWTDRVAFAIAALATVGLWAEPQALATAAQVHALATVGLMIYVAAVVARLEDFPTSSTLRALRLGMVAGAIAQLAWLAVNLAYLGPLAGLPDAAMGAMLTTSILGLLMTQLSLVMNHERRVAHLLASQRKLRNLVDVDTLTRLPNRRHFHELAERAVEAARDAATLIVFDVDRMARVNELLGHPTGDEALRQIGTALRETLRRRDVAGRLGGDDFAVVLPRTRLADSAIVVTRIVASLDDRQVAPRIARVALNVGAVQMVAHETIGEALRRAQAQLVASRDAARRGEAPAAPLEAPAPEEATATPTPSALMSLIPVGEVSVKGAR